MTTKQPRLNVVLEPSIYETLYKMAQREREIRSDLCAWEETL